MIGISILNDVLGPVMRGPSSSHTAGSFHIGRMARQLLGEEPAAAAFTFDPEGPYYQVLEQQAGDLGLAAGLLGWPITDRRFERALRHAAAAGLAITFEAEHLPAADHPNTVEMRLEGRRGATLRATAKSVGGGSIVFCGLDGWPVQMRGTHHEVAVEADSSAEAAVREALHQAGKPDGDELRGEADGAVFLNRKYLLPPDSAALDRIRSLAGVRRVWTAGPLFLPKLGQPLFGSAERMVALAEDEGCSLGRIALAHEARLLGRSPEEMIAAMKQRIRLMRASVAQGLDDRKVAMQLLTPCAAEILRAESAGKVAFGGPHTRAAARALAALHCNCSSGVVCAAPTGGSAGVLPGVLTTLTEEKGLSEDAAALALFAAGGVGVVVAERATFAAEIAGCQVEIGAAGAMAAAAVVDASGGTPRRAADAAAIAFQNTMGSVCDLVQGIVEIPCHTRNAAAAAAAFVCADLAMGGYKNPVPLDETIDAVLAVGKMLPPELRVTSRGGLALAPSARALPRRK